MLKGDGWGGGRSISRGEKRPRPKGKLGPHGFWWLGDVGALMNLFDSTKYGTLIIKLHYWPNFGVLNTMLGLDFDNFNFKLVNF